jgi:RNA polymerase sigma factor (sigma-70 family)
LIIDDHLVLRAGLRMMLERQIHMHVVGEAAGQDEAIEIARAKQPNIILLDLDLGGESGLDLLPKLLEAAPRARVIALTEMCGQQEYRRAVTLGAMGLVFKEQAVETVFRAIEAVYAGEVWLDRAMIADVPNAGAYAQRFSEQNAIASRIASLTERELDVIRLVGEGMKNKQIAERLAISESTVRHHLTSIFGKLGVADRTELVIFAYRHQLARLPR